MNQTVDYLWKGTNFRTSWDHGGPARTYEVTLTAVVPPNSKTQFVKKKGKINGTGSSCGQRFRVSGGSFDTTTKKLSFDMVFIETHPTETFTGILDAGIDPFGGVVVESISGTVKVQQGWLANKTGQVRSLYGRYSASVTLFVSANCSLVESPSNA